MDIGPKYWQMDKGTKCLELNIGTSVEKWTFVIHIEK